MKFLVKIWGLSLFFLPHLLTAQAGLLKGKRVGVYVSSKEFLMNEDYYLQAAQFLKLEEDRSYSGEMDSELLIRLGENFCAQLKDLSGADTVYFLNADIEKGQVFQQAFNLEENKLENPVEISQTDLLLVMTRLHLQTRSHRSVFIRSNRMFTEKVKVKKADMTMTLLDPALPELALEAHSCLDEYQSPKRPQYFDFFQSQSPFGKFLSRLFSQWWWQLEEGIDSNCEE